jgi:hypothetical protein
MFRICLPMKECLKRQFGTLLQEEYEGLLRSKFRGLPKHWIPEIAKQALQAKASSAGVITHTHTHTHKHTYAHTHNTHIHICTHSLGVTRPTHMLGHCLPFCCLRGTTHPYSSHPFVQTGITEQLVSSFSVFTLLV